MSAFQTSRGRKRSSIVPEGLPPPNHVKTEEEARIKELATKGLARTTNLQTELARDSKFHSRRQDANNKNIIKTEVKLDDTTPKDHPIHTLDDLEKDMFGHLHSGTVPTLSKRRKKSKRAESQILNMSMPPNDAQVIPDIVRSVKSKWDLQTVSTYTVTEPTKTQPKLEDKVYGCSRQTTRLYTIRNNEIVELNSNSKTEISDQTATKEKLLDCKETVRRKLTLEEIIKIPRFKEYDPGKPSDTLYIKNLAKGLTEADLIAGCSPCLKTSSESFKISGLKGKLRGQAFITFQDIKASTEALQDLNGLLIKNKPIIVQFAKSQQPVL